MGPTERVPERVIVREGDGEVVGLKDGPRATGGRNARRKVRIIWRMLRRPQRIGLVNLSVQEGGETRRIAAHKTKPFKIIKTTYYLSI